MKIYQVAIFSAVLFALTHQPVQAELEGSFPLEGGKITITPTAGPIQTGGIELVPVEGTVTAGSNPAPFEFFLPNSAAPENVLLASLEPITIDGPVTLDVTVSADAVINGHWAKGTTPTPFPMNGSINIPKPNPKPNPNPGPDSIGASLAGTFPLDGGKITVTPTSGPIQTGGIEFVAEPGMLTHGESPAPFAFFIPNGLAPGNVTLGSVGPPVTIDGPVTLDVTATADAVVSASWGDGSTPVAFPVTGGDPNANPNPGPDPSEIVPLNQESIDFALTTTLVTEVIESELLVLFPEGGGPLTIMGTNGPVSTLGIEFVAEPGMLIQGDNAAPFQFFIDNGEAEGNVTLGSLGVPVVIDEPITLNIFATADAVLSGQWGEGTLATFPAFAVPNVPEPSGQALLLLPAMGMLCLRRRTR